MMKLSNLDHRKEEQWHTLTCHQTIQGVCLGSTGNELPTLSLGLSSALLLFYVTHSDCPSVWTL
jgi:hypothetical protein